MVKQQEKLSLLLFYRWKQSYKFYGILYLLYLLGCTPLLYTGSDEVWPRYETFFDGSSPAGAFLIALVCIVCYGIATLLVMQRKSNGLSRYMILPKSRVSFVISEIMMNMTAILLLLLLQAAVFYLGFRYYVSMATFYDVDHGLYLAISRNAFMRTCIPLTLTQLFILLSSIVTLSSLSVYLGLFFHKSTTLGVTIISLFVYLYVWLYPAGLSFSLERVLQLLLMMVLFVGILWCFQYQMKRNAYGG